MATHVRRPDNDPVRNGADRGSRLRVCRGVRLPGRRYVGNGSGKSNGTSSGGSKSSSGRYAFRSETTGGEERWWSTHWIIRFDVHLTPSSHTVSLTRNSCLHSAAYRLIAA